MQYLYQCLIILGFTFAGETLSRVIPLPIPASVYGILLLFTALQTGILKLQWVKKAGSWLIAIMPILFVAPAVNLLSCWELVAPSVLQILAVVIVSTLVVFVTAGRVTQWLQSRKEKGNG